MPAPSNNPRVSPSPSVTCTASTTTDSCNGDAQQQQDASIYARAWRFVQRRLHLRPRASSCPIDMEATKTVEDPHTDSASSSFCADWQRVHLLKELEEAGARAQWRRQQQLHECIKETVEWTPNFRTQAQRKAAQLTCYNCGLLFFRPLAVAPDTSAFCSRDCQSSFEYQRDLQDAVNECETFRSTVGWTRSSEL
ncbi:hypothetical protein PF005_g13131 [Phytophthora fragariae]|uniref:Uncharacterized protein n=1 Tax=Phytophthora fragariae TaxID=53985 RepID=A0A6A3ETW3_9STRA|nr:hypothetical protein PF003_g24581 [Phytophthora fragariae]KAE8935756.1 hypothetical protein PF009_g14310 [Phytophthora fragariae]KAE9005581.1 hypothetical protein PF011_g11983 [Phytophthora fragariae]KAE9105809.1 hypothetical protein PF010_g12861 [Phytophthora fragariae]KAE9106420.1 hypothetical protein PF007_g13407 [Phytophthora fragariae]